jgi:hypothetical protein
MFLMILSFSGLNAGIVALQSEPIVQTDVPFDTNLQQQEKEIDSILNISHIIGSHTVHIRPPTIVKFNPNQTRYCLGNDQSLYIPFLIKGIPPFYIDYTLSRAGKTPLHVVNKTISNQDRIIASFNPNVSPFYELDSSPVPNCDTRRVALYGLKVSNPGVYNVDQIREQGGDAAKIILHEPVHVSQCPTAKWGPVENKDECLEVDFNLVIEASGIFPISIFFLEQVGNNEKVSVVQSESVLSDPGSEEIHSQQFGTVSIPIKRTIEASEAHVFKLARIIDGFNNSVEFETTNTQLPPTTQKGLNWKINELGDTVAVYGHATPSVSFSQCDGVTIRTEYDPQFESAPVARVPIKFEGTAPFQLEYEFIPDSQLPAQPRQLQKQNSQNAELTALEPGTFQLLSVSDKFCKGSFGFSY